MKRKKSRTFTQIYTEPKLTDTSIENLVIEIWLYSNRELHKATLPNILPEHLTKIGWRTLGALESKWLQKRTCLRILWLFSTKEKGLYDCPLFKHGFKVMKRHFQSQSWKRKIEPQEGTNRASSIHTFIRALTNQSVIYLKVCETLCEILNFI